MMADYRNTLFLPFEMGDLPSPASDEKWAFLNAEGAVQFNLGVSLICEQENRNRHLSLVTAGFDTTPSLEGFNGFDGVLILATRVRKLNEKLVMRAWNALKPGGKIVFAGDKTSGVQSIRKWMSQHCSILGSLSKHHAVVFWAQRTGDDWDYSTDENQIDGFLVKPGMFSAGGIDKGSKLLAEHFDDRIFGSVADFGAGWGFLSSQLLQSSSRLEHLSLYESHWPSLQASRENVPEAHAYHWTDITSEPPTGPFNWIIMNPPFHTGRAADPELGKAFIHAASKALPQGGRLLMVANRNLPYERLLGEVFRKSTQLADNGGFKVIEAMR